MTDEILFYAKCILWRLSHNRKLDKSLIELREIAMEIARKVLCQK